MSGAAKKVDDFWLTMSEAAKKVDDLRWLCSGQLRRLVV